jgi:murein DD-endopeptidase MepM/ murein hydrolase activator NlpD
MMRSPFLVPYVITQRFGVNKAYYGKFGLEGHEGVDMVPDGPYWGIHAIAPGFIIRDEDNERSGTYGTHVRVKDVNGRVWVYAHMSENVVKLGQIINVGDLLGIMGNTGGSLGAHLHLMTYEETATARRINESNGYKGCEDPMLFIEGR